MKNILVTNIVNVAKKWLFTFVCFIMFALTALPLHAQQKWNTTLRTGVNFPLKQLGAADLHTGFGFDVTVGYRVMPYLFVNGGWGWNHFAANNTNADYEENGYILGAQFIHPFHHSTLSFMAGAGAIYNHIEVENSDGDMTADTGHGWGWQAEAGLGIPINKKLRLVPGIRYRSLSRALQEDNIKIPMNLQYLSAGVSLQVSF